jgi:hypothetical protein
MEFFNQESIANLPVDLGNIAMSRGQARQIIDRFAQEAIKKNITPDAFQEGLYYLGQVGQSPDFSRSMIRNTLKSPMGSLVVENPGLASQVAGQFGGMLQAGGVNPALAGKHMGLVGSLLQEAKKDNLLRPNVTMEEVRREIQQPMYGALQDWLKDKKSNMAATEVLNRSYLGKNMTPGTVSSIFPKGMPKTGLPQYAVGIPFK